MTWEDDAGAIRRLYSLTDTQQRPDAPCAALSWSCNGSTLVAGYGRMDHENWCTHKGLVCTWNINRRTLDTHKADLALELPGCVQSLDCHPASNSVFAVGTFNGGVFVADASQPDGQEVVASSGIGQGGHTEPVTQVRWLAGLDARRRRQHFRLVSVAGDGKVLIWAAVRNSATLALLQILPVTAASIPRSLRQGKPSPATATAELGLTCLSFSHENRDLFLLGTEGGNVLKCVLPPGAGADTPPSAVETDAAAAAAAPPPPPLPSPVQFAYTGHRGPVYGLACSPYHRNLFLTASTDMSLSIAHMLERQPAVVLEPGLGYLFDIQWSPVRPLVFAAAGANGLVLLYDLMASQTGPAAILNVAGAKATAADGSGSKAAGGAGGGGSGEAAAAAGLPVVDSGSHRKGEHPVYTLAFNRQRGGLLATGDATGAVHIFNLGQQFSIQVGSYVCFSSVLWLAEEHDIVFSPPVQHVLPHSLMQDPREPGLLDELAGLA